MNKLLVSLWVYLAFISYVYAMSPCPKPFRMATSDNTTVTIKTPCLNSQPISNSSMEYLPIAVRSHGRSRRFSFRISGLKVIRSFDSSPWSRCADPLLFVVYGRSTPGVRGSTFVGFAPLVDFGTDRCSGTFIRKVGGLASVTVPTGRLSFSAYGVVAVERNSFFTFPVQLVIAIAVGQLRSAIIKRVERRRFPLNLSSIISTITRQINSEVKKYRNPFDNRFISDDPVGVNGIIFVHGPRFRKQPSACSRRRFPTCVGGRSISKRIVVGGGLNRNVWQAEIRARA